MQRKTATVFEKAKDLTHDINKNAADTVETVIEKVRNTSSHAVDETTDITKKTINKIEEDAD